MIFFFIFLILSGTLVGAEPTLQPPHLFYGEVMIEGVSAADGLLVVAMIDDQEVGATVTEEGMYGKYQGLVVADPLGNRNGKTVKFYVQGYDTGITSVFSNEESSRTRVDISMSGFCGDHRCLSDENCNNCPGDCGSCPVTESSGSSGSSGGGSGSGGGGFTISSQSDQDEMQVQEDEESNTICVPDWICSEWLECISGKQKRICVDANKCEPEENEDKPIQERECIITQSLRSQYEETSLNVPFDVEEDNINLLNNEKKGLFGITGNVINLSKGSGRGFLIPIAALILIAVVIGKKLKKRST